MGVAAPGIEEFSVPAADSDYGIIRSSGAFIFMIICRRRTPLRVISSYVFTSDCLRSIIKRNRRSEETQKLHIKIETNTLHTYSLFQHINTVSLITIHSHKISAKHTTAFGRTFPEINIMNCRLRILALMQCCGGITFGFIASFEWPLGEQMFLSGRSL